MFTKVICMLQVSHIKPRRDKAINFFYPKAFPSRRVSLDPTKRKSFWAEKININNFIYTCIYTRYIPKYTKIRNRLDIKSAQYLKSRTV